MVCMKCYTEAKKDLQQLIEQAKQFRQEISIVNYSAA